MSGKGAELVDRKDITKEQTIESPRGALEELLCPINDFRALFAVSLRLVRKR